MLGASSSKHTYNKAYFKTTGGSIVNLLVLISVIKYLLNYIYLCLLLLFSCHLSCEVNQWSVTFGCSGGIFK